MYQINHYPNRRVDAQLGLYEFIKQLLNKNKTCQTKPLYYEEVFSPLHAKLTNFAFYVYDQL